MFLQLQSYHLSSYRNIRKSLCQFTTGFVAKVDTKFRLWWGRETNSGSGEFCVKMLM